jgi:ketosteroid isomerase-like protein
MNGLTEIEIALIERACERLVHDFADFVDAREHHLLANLFTEDATYCRPIEPNVVIAGRERIFSMFDSRPKRITRHLCANVRITVKDRDHASGSSRVILIAAAAEQTPDPQFGYKTDARQLIGGYDDEYVRTPQGWRFAARCGHVLLQT